MISVISGHALTNAWRAYGENKFDRLVTSTQTQATKTQSTHINAGPTDDQEEHVVLLHRRAPRRGNRARLGGRDADRAGELLHKLLERVLVRAVLQRDRRDLSDGRLQGLVRLAVERAVEHVDGVGVKDGLERLADLHVLFAVVHERLVVRERVPDCAREASAPGCSSRHRQVLTDGDVCRLLVVMLEAECCATRDGKRTPWEGNVE